MQSNLSLHSSKCAFFKFKFQRSVHCKYIPFDIYPTRRNFTQFIYFWKTALHVSGGISTYHQEHTQLYLQCLVLVKPLLLSAAIVEVLALVGVWCGNLIQMYTTPTPHSDQFQLSHNSGR